MTVGDTDDEQVCALARRLPPDVTFESPTTIVDVPDARCTVEAELTGPHFDISHRAPAPQRRGPWVGGVGDQSAGAPVG